MLLYTAQESLGKVYKDLAIPGGGKGLLFGVVMYANPVLANPRPAPTPLQGTVSPMHYTGATRLENTNML